MLQNIGWRVASAGDFNGDGIGDFMFSCRNFAYGDPGDVFVAKGGADIVTDVTDNADQIQPTGFSVLQNFPNPFNPSTTISFDLPTRVQTSLIIYNVSGQIVRTLISRELSAGSYRIEWDGKDNRGRPVATGVYLYRLTAGTFSESKKMMLVK
jgi:hypothetical protein